MAMAAPEAGAAEAGAAEAGAADGAPLEPGAAKDDRDTVGGAAAVGLAEENPSALDLAVDRFEAWTEAQGKKLIIAAYQGESAKVRQP